MHWSILRFWDILQRMQEKCTFMCLYSYILQLKYTSWTVFTKLFLIYSRPTNLHFSSNNIQQFCFFNTLYILLVLIIYYLQPYLQNIIFSTTNFLAGDGILNLCFWSKFQKKNAKQKKKKLSYCMESTREASCWNLTLFICSGERYRFNWFYWVSLLKFDSYQLFNKSIP